MKLKINYYKLSTIIVLLLAVSFCTAQNQSDTSIYRIETKDGNTYMGQILSEDSVKVMLDSDQLGKINIRKSDIKKMLPIEPDNIKDGKYWFDNLKATRYFYSPNGHALKKGEG